MIKSSGFDASLDAIQVILSCDEAVVLVAMAIGIRSETPATIRCYGSCCPPSVS